jgi:3-hydroxybenzoate 6-monooxygenase
MFFYVAFFRKLIRAFSFSVIIGGKSQKIQVVKSMLIAGGGIAGLATALALARQGTSSTVLEQSESFAEIGAGIQLGPNALRALAALGLREALAPLAFWPESLVIRDALSGARLHGLSLGAAFEKRFRERYACVHRGDLLKILLDACRDHPKIRLCSASSLVSVSSDTYRVTLTDSLGQQYEGTGLIGADGLWSTIRKSIYGEQAPRFSGDIALRALIPNTLGRRNVSLWLGPQLHVVAYPVKAGALLNIVAICEYQEGRSFRGWDEAVPADLVKKFGGHHPLLNNLLAEVPHWSAWALHDRDPIQVWAKGRTVLLGDAAHPCLQYLAQGACLALEDAVAIAKQVAAAKSHHPGSEHFNPEDAFSAFSQERQARGARMIRTARRMGQLYHASGFARSIRNLGMQVTPPWLSRESMAWIYEV